MEKAIIDDLIGSSQKGFPKKMTDFKLII